MTSDYRRRKESEAYKLYVTDVLKGIGDCNVKYFSRNNSAELVKMRFADILHPKKADDRTAAEIAADILKKGGFSIKVDEDTT